MREGPARPPSKTPRGPARLQTHPMRTGHPGWTGNTQGDTGQHQEGSGTTSSLSRPLPPEARVSLLSIPAPSPLGLSPGQAKDHRSPSEEGSGTAGEERTGKALRPPHLVTEEEHLPVTRPGFTDPRTQFQKSPPPCRRLRGEHLSLLVARRASRSVCGAQDRGAPCASWETTRANTRPTSPQRGPSFTELPARGAPSRQRAACGPFPGGISPAQVRGHLRAGTGHRHTAHVGDTGTAFTCNVASLFPTTCTSCFFNYEMMFFTKVTLAGGWSLTFKSLPGAR